MKKVLKLKANGDKLFPNIHALPLRRFVGWRFNPNLGVCGGWELGNDETVPYCHEYVKAVKEGDLLPADKETAKLCGVTFSL